MKITNTYLLVALLSLLSVVGLACFHNDIISDASIVTQIKDKLKNEPVLKNANVEVSSSYGNVIVSGLVDTKLQVEKIVTFVQSIKWVKDVDTKNLKVKDSNTPLTDIYITAKVKGALIRDRLLDVTTPSSIQVETKNNIVYLSGKVNNQKQVNEIVASAKSVRGVDSIENGLIINQ